jgi:hypothetical protein
VINKSENETLNLKREFEERQEQLNSRLKEILEELEGEKEKNKAMFIEKDRILEENKNLQILKNNLEH